jgi:hypothetical protein
MCQVFTTRQQAVGQDLHVLLDQGEERFAPEDAHATLHPLWSHRHLADLDGL